MNVDGLMIYPSSNLMNQLHTIHNIFNLCAKSLNLSKYIFILFLYIKELHIWRVDPFHTHRQVSNQNSFLLCLA